MILQLVKFKISFLSKRNKSCPRFARKQKICKSDDLKLDNVTSWDPRKKRPEGKVE